MEANVVSMLQRSSIVLFFFAAVAAGVHSAAQGQQQFPQAQMPPGPPPGAQAQFPPQAMPTQFGAPQGQAIVPPSAPAASAAGQAQAQPPGFPPPPDLMPQQGLAPSPTPAQAFVPSEVQQVLPASAVKDQRFALLRTSLGDIVIRLFQAEAPRTVANFVDLARGEKEFIDVKTGKKTKRPFYNGLTFHRTVKGFLIQTGCPYGTGRGGPGYNVNDEIAPNLKHDRPGIVSMALARDLKPGAVKENTNGSQFFITLTPQPELDGKYTIFGEVVKGMSVVEKISRVKTGPTERPIKRVYLYEVSIQDNSNVPSTPAHQTVAPIAVSTPSTEGTEAAEPQTTGTEPGSAPDATAPH